MNKRLKHGVNTFCGVAEYLNSEIRKNGQLQENNYDLWRQYFHSFDNDDWIDLYLVISSLSETRYIKGSHSDLFDDIIDKIDKHGDYYNNVMDMKKRGFINHKKIAWKAVMYIREIYCDIQDIYLPNSDESIETVKEKLFQVE